MKHLHYTGPRALFRNYEIMKCVKNVNNHSIFIEIGAGSLALTRQLLGEYHNGVVIDFNNEIKKRVKTLPDEMKERIIVVVDDFFKYRSNSKFDLVIAAEVLEHVEREKKFITKLFNITSKDGLCIVSVPAKMKYWSIHDEIVGHVKRYEKKELMELFKDSGFYNIQIISYGFPFTVVFRFFRVFLAKMQSKSLKNLNNKNRTKKSGFNYNSSVFSFLGLIFNPIIFYPLFLASSLFNSNDLSNGYIIVGEKL